MQRKTKRCGGPHFPKGVPILPGKMGTWGPQNFMTPDSSLCRAAAPRLRPLQLLLLARLHRSVSTAAELPACIHFSCFSPLTSASVASLDCVRFNWFPIASASAAAPRMRRLQLCSPIVSASAALLLPASCSRRFQPCPLFSNILVRRVRGSVNIEVRRSRVTTV